MTARLHVDSTEAYCIMAKRLGCHVGSEQTMAAWRRASLKRYMSMQRAGCPSRPARPAHTCTPSVTYQSSTQICLDGPLKRDH